MKQLVMIFVFTVTLGKRNPFHQSRSQVSADWSQIFMVYFITLFQPNSQNISTCSVKYDMKAHCKYRNVIFGLYMDFGLFIPPCCPMMVTNHVIIVKYLLLQLTLQIPKAWHREKTEGKKKSRNVQSGFHFLNSLRKADYFSHSLLFSFPLCTGTRIK